MLRLTACVLMLCGGLAFAEDAKDVEKKLAGTWIVEKAWFNQEVYAEMKGAEFTFKDGTLMVKPAKEKEYTVTYTIGQAGKEFEIDFASKEKVAHPDGSTGLARIDGDTLLISVGPGKRPSILREDVQGAPKYKLVRKK